MENNTIAPVAPGQEHATSTELATQIAEVVQRRREMSEQTEKARVDLTEKRAAIRFLKPKSLDEATIAQARFTVLSDAGIALEEELTTLHTALEEAEKREQRARDQEELHQLRAQLDDEKTQLKTLSLDAATALQRALDQFNAGQGRVTMLTHQIGWKREALGAGAGDVAYGFADGHLASHLSESGQVETVIIQEFITAAQRLRQSRHIDQHGITIWNDAPRQLGDGVRDTGADLSGIMPATAQDAAAGLANALKP